MTQREDSFGTAVNKVPQGVRTVDLHSLVQKAYVVSGSEMRVRDGACGYWRKAKLVRARPEVGESGQVGNLAMCWPCFCLVSR